MLSLMNLFYQYSVMVLLSKRIRIGRRNTEIYDIFLKPIFIYIAALNQFPGYCKRVTGYPVQLQSLCSATSNQTTVNAPLRRCVRPHHGNSICNKPFIVTACHIWNILTKSIKPHKIGQIFISYTYTY